MKIQNIFFIGLLGIMLSSAAFLTYGYLAEETCTKYPHEDSTIKAVYVSENIAVPKYQLLVMEFDDNYTDVYINQFNFNFSGSGINFIEDLSNDTNILAKMRNITNSTKSLKVFNVSISGNEIDIPIQIEARKSICKRRISEILGL